MKTQIIQPLVKLRRVVYGMIALGCAYGLSYFIYPSLLSASTQATAGVATEPTLEISPSNTVSFSVTPGTFNSASQTLSVRTTNYTGYKLTLSADTSADLVGSRGTIPTITLPSGSSSITSSSITNGYGYSLNATDYKPVLTGEGSTLDTTSVPNTTANTYTLTFGANVNRSVPAGAYTKALTLTATANDTGYVITYDANAGSDTVTGMPSPNPKQETVSGLSVNLSDATPTRTGYSFLGWSENSAATSATYQPSATITLDPETANSKTLYAIWEVIDPMQNWLGCSALSNGDTATLRDTRDGNIYSIAKINNQCWMTKNLDLPGGTTLSHADTNVPENYSTTTTGFVNGNTLPASSTSGFSDNATAYVYNSNSTTCGDNSPCYSYYSWLAATAGYNATSNDTSVNYDICPSGWRLPTQAEFNTLKNTYTTGATLTASPFLGVYGGLYNYSLFSDGGSSGYYWSSTADGSNFAYYLNFSSGNAYVGSYVKRYGFSVRCVAKTSYTLNYDANGGSGAPDSQAGFPETGSYTFTLSNTAPTKSGKTFYGWSINQDASTIDYQPGDTFTTTNTSSTLYAVWEANFDAAFAAAGKTKTNGYYKMQDMSIAICSNVTDGQTGTLIDIRNGNKTYTVGKFLGNCWMTQNLDLPGGTTLSHADTNVPENYSTTTTGFTNGNTLPASSTSGFSSSTTAYVYNSGSTTCGSNSPCYSYYSWLAATAGYTSSSSTTAIAGDICPSGWRLPTQAEFNTLKNTYTTGATLTASPFLGVYGGYYDDSSFYNGGSYGNYWSSTAVGSSSASRLYFGSSSAIVNNRSKYHGFSIRCVAQDSYTLEYDANGGSGAPNSQSSGTSSATSYTFTLSNTQPTRTDYNFLGWSTDPSATTASYQPDGTYTATSPNTTLYAVWKVDFCATHACMQSQTQSTLATLMPNDGDTATLYDKRDEQAYSVAKILGNYWMTKNLNLPGGTTLSHDDTNVPANYSTTTTGFTNGNTLPASSTSGFSDNATAYVYNSNSTTCGNNSPCYSYYSWRAATAGYNSSSSSTPVNYDICPAGWRLPTQAEFNTLKNTYTTGATLTASPFLGVYGGSYSNGSFGSGGSNGLYWSSTAVSSTSAYSLGFTSGSAGVSPYNISKRAGFSIRCVAQE